MEIKLILTILAIAGCAAIIEAKVAQSKRAADKIAPFPLPIDCATVRCARPIGCSDEDLFTPPGQCCPICKPDCSAVSCLRPVCEEGEVLETPLGECCPVCTRPNCAAVLCLALTPSDCKKGQILVTPPGECCAQCQPDCSAVSCLRPVCEEGESLVTPPGECCPQCQLDCSAVSCLKPVCEEGEVLETPLGECCPVCTRPNCAAVLCLALTPSDCKKGQILVTPPGECCAQCQPDCSAVSCLRPVCEEGESLVTPPGECCPQCQLDCSAVSCLKPVCEEGEVLETPLGECCPVCTRPNCAAVLCLALTPSDCKKGQILVTPPGECCAQCQPDCSAVSCLRPVCEEGESLEVPEGECCPICVPTKPQCDISGQVFSDCASPCPRTCENPNVICLALCRPGCTCPPGQVIDTSSNSCVTVDECPDEECPYEGQGFSFCPGCDSTCIDVINEELRFCPAVCRPGCGCPGAQLIDTIAGRCVTRNNCTNPCALVDCVPGAKCKVFRSTGEAFCEPSCDIANGGCPKDKLCHLNQVQCVRAPCPPQVECLNPTKVCALKPEAGPCEAAIKRFFHNSTSGQCESFVYGGCQGNANNFETLEQCQSACGVVDACATERCRVGHRCEVFEPTGEAFCAPNCSLNNGGCAKDELCSLQTVQCVRAPCPPVVQCVSRCAAVRCGNGRCEIHKPTGEPFCNPDCSLNNGGCSDGQICSLKEVECKREPCPPVVQCSCPPTCSKEFCSYNRRAMCSNPGPREIPGCTGSCQLTYCKACIFSSDEVVVPSGLDQCEQCSDLADYRTDSTCFWRWARCTGNKYWRANRPNRRTGEYSDEHIICLNPPCPFKG